MRSWDLLQIDAPEGIRTPAVLHAGDARAIMLRLEPGQALGDHQVRERAWVTVVDGEAEMTCGDSVVKGGVGTLVMFEPGERHSVSSEAGARLLLLLAPWPADGHYSNTTSRKRGRAQATPSGGASAAGATRPDP